MRQGILVDILAMAEAGAPLAPGFFSQLGMFDEAAVVEARLNNQQQQQLMPNNNNRRRRLPDDQFVVESILDERKATRTTEAVFFVQWQGCHHSWERWRTSGRRNAGIAL